MVDKRLRPKQEKKVFSKTSQMIKDGNDIRFGFTPTVQVKVPTDKGEQMIPTNRQPSHDTTRRGKHMNISHLAFASMIATVLYSFAFVIQSALNIIIQSDRYLSEPQFQIDQQKKEIWSIASAYVKVSAIRDMICISLLE
ncbi:hypothetical protein OUZ56_015354 [Daphnia magna]|uniref:Uncharacterized protein n=1 Tax=Daphnia magna TaxID=35525 RepID=A0ABR0AMK5_9CRUS|nr:hypothetical protein OUZ56_015354 [Daphnia magna]